MTGHGMIRRTLLGVPKSVAYVAIIGFFSIPFLWMLLGSFRPDAEIFRYVSPFSVRTLWPETWTLDNYRDIFGLSQRGALYGLDMRRNLLNSVVVSSAVVVGGLVINTLAAYFFSRSRFRYKNALFVLILAVMLVPWQATIVPMYLVADRLNLTNTLLALIVPWLANPFLIFFLRAMFDRVPVDLDEAAMIDGASRLRILRSVLLPSMAAALVTATLLDFQIVWNHFFWPLVAVSSQDLQVVQIAVQSQAAEESVYWGRTFAASVIACAPIVIFVLFQRFYVQGITMEGLKE